MSLFNAMQIAGSGMSAQTVRLNAVASNLSNANSVSGSANDVYKAKYPIFETTQQPFSAALKQASAGVRVTGVVESDKAPNMRFEPSHPQANEKGYVYTPNVNVIAQMADMMSASRSYQINLQVMNASKNLTLQTLNIGK